MNFKMIIRAAKLKHNKFSYWYAGHRFVNADNNLMVWAPDSDTSTRDIDDVVVNHRPAGADNYGEAALKALSPPLDQMIKVNGELLRRAIGALESKGQSPIYLDILAKRICIAYQVGDEIHRAAVACMDNT